MSCPKNEIPKHVQAHVLSNNGLSVSNSNQITEAAKTYNTKGRKLRRRNSQFPLLFISSISAIVEFYVAKVRTLSLSHSIFNEPIPPSNPITCPVIQLLLLLKRKVMASARSFGWPILPSGWRLLEASIFSGVLMNFSANPG